MLQWCAMLNLNYLQWISFPFVSWSIHLGIYFSVCLALMVISLLETVIITSVLHHSSMKYQEVPNWVRVVVLKHLARLICYHFPQAVQPPTVPQKDKPDRSNGDSGLWVIQPASQTPAQHPVSTEGNWTVPVKGKHYLDCTFKYNHRVYRSMYATYSMSSQIVFKLFTWRSRWATTSLVS